MVNPDKSGPVQLKVVHTEDYNGGYGEGVHLFPFRTEKLRPSALMVLP